MNKTIFQCFEWYLPADGSLYKNLISTSSALAANGFTHVWMPPASKGFTGRNDVGYGVYDLYDLGEFRQKGSIGTKYGTKTQYLKAIQSLQKKKIQVIADVVLNHRMGADQTEDIMARNMDESNRYHAISAYHPVQVWTRYTFEGRNGKYSSFQWNWTHFTGTDWDELSKKHGILEFEGKNWNPNVSKENGNFDYVMGSDIDFSNPEVIHHLYQWGKWYTKTTGVNGFRLDAVKSIDSQFFPQWLNTMHRYGNHPNLAIGEYWTGNIWELKEYLSHSGYCMKLMDVPLHYHLMQAAGSNGTYDIRNLYAYTLSQTDPEFSCSFVDNHDTQPGQALESWVMDWFKPQAYASILLNRCKLPCVFYGDYYGIPHNNKQPVWLLREMIWIRANLLEDNIVDLYDDDLQKACWMAYSTAHPVLVLFTIADWKEKTVHEPSFAGMTFEDAGNPGNKVTFNSSGDGRLTCPPGGLSVYILEKDAAAMKKALKTKGGLRSLLSRKKS
ncbi:MAG: alpha-amylase [Ileibacterium sp.]|nr:alpha-amylase [Ileibacterium sp.]